MGNTIANLIGCGYMEQGRVGLVENLGEYSRSLDAGCFCIIPCLQSVRYTHNLRQQQLSVTIGTKTMDNVFCTVKIAIFYRLSREEINLYTYNVNDFQGMANSIVQDQVRSILCKISLDEAYETKDELTNVVKEALSQQLGKFGVNFITVIVNDIEPDLKVKTAMNEINRQDRLRIAIAYEAEARKIQLIKHAEAEAEAKKLSGMGLAEQRRAIVEGLSSSISNFVENVHDVNPEQVMHLIMMNQYFDTLKDLGVHSRQNTIFLPHNPTSVNELYQQLANTAASHTTSSFKLKHPNPIIKPDTLGNAKTVKLIEEDDHDNNILNNDVIKVKGKKSTKGKKKPEQIEISSSSDSD